MAQLGQAGTRGSWAPKRRLVIDTITGGPHPIKKSSNEMERFGSSLKHVVHESCLPIENGAPAKHLRLMIDDTVFRNHDAGRSTDA